MPTETTRVQVPLPIAVARKAAKLAKEDQRSLGAYVAILVTKALKDLEP